MQEASLPRKNFYYGPWLMLRPVFLFAALWARNFMPDRHLGCLRGVRFRLPGVGQRGPVRGCAPPRPPLHSPRNTPLRELSISVGRRGHASCAAGASFPRGARSGDLPPRRVNARVRLRVVWWVFQPNTINKLGCCRASFVFGNH